MFCRRINFPFIGEIEPSTIVLCSTALLLIHSVSKILLMRFHLQLFVLAFGILNAYMLGNQTAETWTWVLPILIVFVFGALAEIYIKTEKDLDKLSTIFIIISFVIAVTGILAYYGFADGVVILAGASPETLANDGAYSRTYGIAYDNTVLGYAPISLIFLTGKKWPKLYKAIIFVFIVVAVLISLKRLAYLSLLFSVLYIIFKERKNITLLPLLVVCSAIIGAFIFYGNVILGRFQNVQNVFLGQDSPDINRTSRIDYALHAIREHPILGNGSGYLTFIHNGYLEMIGNLGILALIFIIPWVVRPVKTLFARTDLRQKDWAIACIIYLLSVFLLEAALNRFELMWIFALLYGGFTRSVRIYGLRKSENIQWKKEKLALQY
jgi:O-antigen ligase